MFNQKKDYESDFCESYKSQILGNDEHEEGDSLFSTMVKLLTILILLSVIMGVSFYGYNYFMNSQKISNIALPPVSMQTFDDDLVVTMEENIEPKKIEKEEESTSIPIIVTPQIEEKEVEEKEVEEIVNDIKVTIDKSELKEKNISIPLIVTPQIEEDEIEKMANDVKIAIAKSELKEENETKVEEKIVQELKTIVKISQEEELNHINKEESLEVPTSVPEAKYLEELADLSKEIDKERNQ